MEQISCIFCHEPSNNTVIEENGFNGQQCPTCQLIFISPRPTEQDIINLYGHDEAHIGSNIHISQSFSKRLHARHTLSLMPKAAKNGLLLEIGAGAGYFLDEARRYGYKPHAIELNHQQAQFIESELHIPCEKKLLSDNSFGDTTFDVIYHSDVISHFFDPIEAFQTMYRKLKPGGYLIFETGNIADIDPEYYSYFTAFQYPDHLFFFGENTIEKLLKMTGFNLEKMHRYTITPQLMIKRFLDARRTHSAGSKSAKNTYQPATFAGNFVKNCYYYAMHQTRYSLGSCIPKNKRPQTIIVVALKV